LGPHPPNPNPQSPIPIINYNKKIIKLTRVYFK